jgi:hypothetical protein
MRVERLTEEKAPTLGPFLVGTGLAQRKWAAPSGPSLGRKRPRRGVRDKYREGGAQMRGVLLSHDELSSLNYVHESSLCRRGKLGNVRNQTLRVAPFWALRRHPSAGLEVCTTSSMKRLARSIPHTPRCGRWGCGVHAPAGRLQRLALAEHSAGCARARAAGPHAPCHLPVTLPHPVA